MNTTPSTSKTACPTCGTTVTGGARFCASCGADVRAQQAHVATSELHGMAPPDVLLERLRAATIGEYEVYGELGRGGMAVVYLAHDIALDRKVAIKVMLPELVTGPGMAERFKREARTAGSLSHPHIIPIYAVKEAGGLVYFVMKFVEGRGVDSIIAELGPLPIPMVQTVLAQVAGTLAHAHRKHVVHRDVKPGNIMIDEDGWAVVTDFGIAKVRDATSLTSTGAAIGTPLYMSPEQGSGKPVTGASDQYSLGVTAYEMLTGVTPFNGPTMMEVLSGHFFNPPEPVRTLRPDCPPALEAVVMRMLAKELADRFPTLDDVAAAVNAPPLAHDDPVRAQLVALAKSHEHLRPVMSVPTSPSPPTKLLRRGARSSRKRAALVAGGVIVLVGVVVAGRAMMTRAPGVQTSLADSTHRAAEVPVTPDTTGRRSFSPPPVRPQPTASKSLEQRRNAGPPVRPRSDTTARSTKAAAPVGTGIVVLGTRAQGAAYYVNDKAAGVLTGLQHLVLPAGQVKLKVAVEGCTPWDTTITVQVGETLVLGYKSPKCN